MTNNYTIQFAATNNNLQNYYVTFVPAPNTPEAFSATLNGNSISDYSSFAVTTKDTINVSSLAWLGNMFISTQAFNNDTPVYTNNNTNSFQCIEFSGVNSTSSQPGFIKADVSYIDWYSIPIMIENTNTGASCSVPSANFSQAAILQDLESLTNSPSTTVITDSDGNFLRIIGPTAEGSYIGTYPSFNAYLESMFVQGLNNYHTYIDLSNIFDGVQDPADVTQQRQNYNNYDKNYNGYMVYYDGSTLKIKGKTTFLNPLNNQPNGATSTFIILAEGLDINTFSNNIYLAQCNYSWVMDYNDGQGNTQTLSNPNATVGDNNVFSAIVRDLLAGFAFGFVQSKVTDDLTNVYYGAESSQNWQNADGSKLFNDLQSNIIATPPPYYYNSWANVLYQYLIRSYSFPFTDFVSAIGPQLLVNAQNNLLVTILN